MKYIGISIGSFIIGIFFMSISFQIISDVGVSLFMGSESLEPIPRGQLGDHDLREFIISSLVGLSGIANGIWYIFLFYIKSRKNQK